MAKFNPNFWEVTISQESWERFSTEDGLHFESPEDAERRCKREYHARILSPELRIILNKVLTPRQHDIVLMYFFESMNQGQISEQLGITQQSVSEHLHGKMRNGGAVGGAIRKLRKAWAAKGLKWEL